MKNNIFGMHRLWVGVPEDFVAPVTASYQGAVIGESSKIGCQNPLKVESGLTLYPSQHGNIIEQAWLCPESRGINKSDSKGEQAYLNE